MCGPRLAGAFLVSVLACWSPRSCVGPGSPVPSLCRCWLAGRPALVWSCCCSGGLLVSCSCGRAACGISWLPVRWRGPPGLARFVLRALFPGTLRDFFLLGTIWFEPASGGRGSLYYPLLSGCGLFVGARRGRLSFGSLRLDDVSRKNCI